MDVLNELDEQYVIAAQDPNEQIWASDETITAMRSVADPNDEHDDKVPVLRNSAGGLDFLNDVVEEVTEFLSLDNPVKPSKPRLDDIHTKEMGSDKWRGRTATVTDQQGSRNSCVVTKSDYRRSLLLYNTGPNIAYISSIAGATAGGPNTFPVPVSTPGVVWAPIQLPSKDDVWAVCAAGQTAVLGIIEVFDMEC